MEKEAFQDRILTWYKENKRDLPWRTTTNPYYIHLSEIMLQQTQVDRVVSYYETFLKECPTLQELADLPKDKLLLMWQGLGYNNRAIRLQQAAKELLERYDGKYPQSKELLMKLPGIGSYTASAILAFAFNKDVAVVDTNIRRILIHEFQLDELLHEQKLEDFALTLLPSGQSRDYHNALMDYGATILTARKTNIKPTSKQGKFEGSTRWVRSQILKRLLTEKEIETSTLDFPDHNIDTILGKMEKDKLLKIKGEKITLS